MHVGTLLYEVWARLADGRLFPVPVLVTRLVENGNSRPNSDSDRSNDRHVRRFALFDNSSGLNPSNELQAVRWARSLSLQVTIDAGEGQGTITSLVRPYPSHSLTGAQPSSRILGVGVGHPLTVFARS